ncbi:MAG TPA: class I SAM-dependent methyltransferase [Chryseosolibacter sp.]
MSRYYPANYYSLQKDDGEKFSGLKGRLRRLTLSALIFNRNAFDRFIRRFYSPISLRVLRDLNITRDTRILDVGCGSGRKFLYPLAELNFTKIAGCDPFLEQDIGYPNGLKIYRSDIFAMKGKWDIITYHHVFEHVANPLQNLLKVKALLTENGICILRMPTVSSFAWEHYRENWVQLDAPRHYFLHSIESVQYLAAEAGMSLFRLEFDSTYKQFADSERYLLGESLRSPRKRGLLNFLKRKMRKVRYRRMASRMNRLQKGDQAVFFLRKSAPDSRPGRAKAAG